jgi:hypothetical protein
MGRVTEAVLLGRKNWSHDSFFRSIEGAFTWTSCWKWGRHLNPQGYGKSGGKLAHRRAYQLAIGPIPGGLVLDHLCRTRRCVNPLHLELVTSAENTRRGDLNGYAKRQLAKTHCPQGHPYDEANTYMHVHARGRSRRCRICNTTRNRRYRHEDGAR